MSVAETIERLGGYDRVLALARQIAEEEARVKAANVIAQQDEAIDDFGAFVRYCWDEMVPGAPMIWAPHMAALCREVQAVMEESWRRRAACMSILARHPDTQEGRTAAAAEIDAELGHLPPLRLALLVPPRHSKSIIVQRALPAWIWLHRPGDQVLALACTDSLVDRDALHLRDLAWSAKYKALVARAVARGVLASTWEIRPDKTAVGRFMTSAGGARSGHVYGGTWTGVDADVIGLDDVIDVKEVEEGTAEQVARRMAAIRGIYANKVRDRLNSKIWGVIVLIMQRLNPADLAGLFIDEGARVVCLPARYEPDHPQVYEYDWRTEPGEPLNPLREPVGVLDLEEANNAYWFATKWQQRTSAREGGQIKREWFSARYNTSPLLLAQSADEVWVTSDAAKKGKATSDRHAIQVWARKGATKYLLFRWANRVNYPEYERALDGIILTWAQHLSQGGVIIEDTANGTTYMQMRRGGIPGPNGRPVVVALIPFTPKVSKQERAIAIERAAEAGQIMLPAVAVMPGVEALLDEWCAFPHGAHDDEVDAASQLFGRWGKSVTLSPDMIRWYTG